MNHDIKLLKKTKNITNIVYSSIKFIYIALRECNNNKTSISEARAPQTNLSHGGEGVGRGRGSLTINNQLVFETKRERGGGGENLILAGFVAWRDVGQES